MRGDRGFPESRRYRPCENERAHERGGADEDPLAEGENSPCERELHSSVTRLEPPQDDDDEGDAHPKLRDRRPPRRALDPPAEAVHEQHLEDDVHDVRRDEDDERRPQVRDPSQVALRAERENAAGKPIAAIRRYVTA